MTLFPGKQKKDEKDKEIRESIWEGQHPINRSFQKGE